MFECLGGGDGKNAGASADVEDRSRTKSFQHIVEGDETAPRGRVMRRAERLTCVDLDC
jgi:hypothetical protein